MLFFQIRHPSGSARHAGFTLIEMLVVMVIVVLLGAVSMPGLRRMRNSIVHNQFRATVLAAMQANIALVNTYRSPNADNAEPRVFGATYAGTAVVFDKDRALIRFANNNQVATDTAVADRLSPTYLIERQTFTLSGKTWNKKAYDFLPAVEPARIGSSVGVVGVMRDDKGTLDPSDDVLQMVPMPFAVCAGADSYGIPSVPAIYTDLDGNGTYDQIPACLPVVIVYLRDDLEMIGVNPDDLSTLPGATDQAKIQMLLGRLPGHGGGLLVDLSLQNGVAVDTP